MQSYGGDCPILQKSGVGCGVYTTYPLLKNFKKNFKKNLELSYIIYIFILNINIMKHKHFIIITDNILNNLSEIVSIPNEYKENIKNLLLSKDSSNIKLVTEILKTLYPNKEIIFIKDITKISKITLN